MTILRECPDHRVALSVVGGRLACLELDGRVGEYAVTPLSVKGFARPVMPRPCSYTEPLPPDLEMRALNAPELALDFDTPHSDSP